MSRMKTQMLALAMAFAQAGSQAGQNQPQYQRRRLTKEEEKEKEERLNKAKGLSLFTYDKGEVWALNQKSADKKAIKRGYIDNPKK